MKKKAVLGRPEGLWACVATGILFFPQLRHGLWAVQKDCRNWYFSSIFGDYFFFGVGGIWRSYATVSQLVVSAMCAHRYGHMRP